MTETTDGQIVGHVGTDVDGEHLALPSGTTSAFAVGDLVTVTNLGAEDAPTDSLIGQTGPVVSVVWLPERLTFGYFVTLDTVRGIQFTPAGVIVDTTWALTESELMTVVANG